MILTSKRHVLVMESGFHASVSVAISMACPCAIAGTISFPLQNEHKQFREYWTGLAA